MSARPDFPRRERFGRDYWLMRCVGFHVDVGGRQAGVVSDVLFGSRLDCPDHLAVRAGLLGRRLVLVPVEEVEEIDPREKALRVRSLPRSAASEPEGLVARTRRRLRR